MMLNIYFVCLSYLLITTVCSKADVVRCKPDYRFYNEACGWLKLHTNPEIWEVALRTCHYEGAVLASPLNKHLANAFHSIMSQSNLSQHIYLGTSDVHSKDDFASVEGVLLSDLEIKWSNGVQAGDCLTMSVDGDAYYMHKSKCFEALPFICYKKLTNKTLNECGTFDNEYHLNQQTGSCYKLHTEKQNWSRAYKTCSLEGAYLAIVNDQTEANVLQAMFPPACRDASWYEGFHIGLRAWGSDRISGSGSDRVWITIHGERLQDVFHVWSPETPDNRGGIQDRGVLLRNANLEDVAPDVTQMFVCERNPRSKRYEAAPPGAEDLCQHVCD